MLPCGLLAPSFLSLLTCSGTSPPNQPIAVREPSGLCRSGLAFFQATQCSSDHMLLKRVARMKVPSDIAGPHSHLSFLIHASVVSMPAPSPNHKRERNLSLYPPKVFLELTNKALTVNSASEHKSSTSFSHRQAAG